MKKISSLLYTLIILCAFTACDLDEEPKAKTSKEQIFGNEAGLKLYANSFYDMLPARNDAHQMDKMCDYAVRTDIPDFIRKGVFTNQSSGIDWSWGNLRNVNFFIQNCNDERVPLEKRNNYLGIARFFRAYFYFEKVKRFGDVPWINKAMDVNDPDLYATRDSRTLVMDSVLADLNFAARHIIAEKDESCSNVTKNVVLAYKSRICLFEGTFRKYHTDLNLSATADKWLTEATDAANEVIKGKKYSLNTKSGENKSYRELFISFSPVNTEVILADVVDKSLSILHNANWWWTSSTYGSRVSFNRLFVNTYLNIDGTPFTNNPGYKTMSFFDETQNRDKRLEQTIRTPGYTRVTAGKENVVTPEFSYTYTGYQPIKYTLDDTSYDTGGYNENSLPLIRYAEVLLNYAEAKAELGTFTDTDWANTIGLLRARAGIQGGLTNLPTTVDTYLQATYFPEISDPVLLEIRRERSIELAWEGLRFPDLLRWKKGELIELDWNGIYIPALDEFIDLDENGTPDLYVSQSVVPEKDKIRGVAYLNVSEKVGGKANPQQLSQGTSGELTWLNNMKSERVWEDKKYYYPIPSMAIIMNSNLKQNKGWE